MRYDENEGGLVVAPGTIVIDPAHIVRGDDYFQVNIIKEAGRYRYELRGRTPYEGEMPGAPEFEDVIVAFGETFDTKDAAFDAALGHVPGGEYE